MTSAAEAAIQELGLDAANVEERRRVVGLAPEDAKRIAGAADLLRPLLPEIVEAFFAHLQRFEGGGRLLDNPRLLEQARQLKLEHLEAMLQGDYGLPYCAQRVRLGLLYGRAELPPNLFLGAYQEVLEAMGQALARSGGIQRWVGAYGSLRKVALLDIGLIVDVLIAERERIIRHQAEAIRELSVPVLQLRERMLLLPLIGTVDTHRARLVTESLLEGIRVARARAVVMDITGVATVDTKVAHHLLQTIAAARLMGANVIVTGLSPEISQSLVLLGIDLRRVTATSDLQSGLEAAERLLAEEDEGLEPSPLA